jgi:hypothetical protein
MCLHQELLDHSQGLFHGILKRNQLRDEECKESQLGRRYCLSKEVAIFYITIIPWCTRMEYNKNIYTFLRSYNRLGRILCECQESIITITIFLHTPPQSQLDQVEIVTKYIKF